ncbi:NAD(P)-dependent oxidoreductase [Burkholderia sp. Nafp2/4-1b]|uniref:NAD(P)-dependent oxidoreductase n=1 Tax=Burkholderia sp. Nafp2/4-1b TaxID=2116686 RepID=UPI000EF858E6|nr:NAD(P)-dependent oxidoreductase [Burkholderia sp. Nafp2/4-1b]RKT99376.1 NAD(P)-dependent oxidoreductase [Burkholderia sp. Nafp2/4-1b]
MKRQIGLIGVGLMGHGIARNVLKHGYPLTVVEHPGNQPLDELLRAGVRTVKTARELALQADVVILCVTGSPEVEAVLTGEQGVLAGLKDNAIVVDCSTAVPESTVRMARRVEAAGGRLVDAPMTRGAREAHEGRLNLLVGATPAVFDEIRPVLACFAENITRVGELGAGHSMKLLHNFVSLGTIALLSEAVACAKRAGVDTAVLADVLANGGGGGVALNRLRPFLETGDTSSLPFHMANAFKDLSYYSTMAEGAEAAHAIASAVTHTYRDAVASAGAHCPVLKLSDVLGATGVAGEGEAR